MELILVAFLQSLTGRRLAHITAGNYRHQPCGRCGFQLSAPLELWPYLWKAIGGMGGLIHQTAEFFGPQTTMIGFDTQCRTDGVE